MEGATVDLKRYNGFTSEAMDKSCAMLCRANPSCEFWVRSVTTSECWLKKGFRTYLDSRPTELRRGAFARDENELGVVFIKQPKVSLEQLLAIDESGV